MPASFERRTRRAKEREIKKLTAKLYKEFAGKQLPASMQLTEEEKQILDRKHNMTRED